MTLPLFPVFPPFFNDVDRPAVLPIISDQRSCFCIFFFFLSSIDVAILNSLVCEVAKGKAALAGGIGREEPSCQRDGVPPKHQRHVLVVSGSEDGGWTENERQAWEMEGPRPLTLGGGYGPAYRRPLPSSKKVYSRGMFVSLRCGLLTCRISGRSQTTTSFLGCMEKSGRWEGEGGCRVSRDAEGRPSSGQ